jgi:hypothetical protein
MRLRIQTYNPLPEIKAWFIPNVQSATSVYDLKEALCLRFRALKADLICVKLSPLAQVEDVEMQPGEFFFVFFRLFLIQSDTCSQIVVFESNITRQRMRKRSQSPSLLIPGLSV